MPAVSVKQRRFMGMVRAVQKGEMSAPSKEIASAASDMKKTDVKKFASTKAVSYTHLTLPTKA